MLKINRYPDVVPYEIEDSQRELMIETYVRWYMRRNLPTRASLIEKYGVDDIRTQMATTTDSDVECLRKEAARDIESYLRHPVVPFEHRKDRWTADIPTYVKFAVYWRADRGRGPVCELAREGRECDGGKTVLHHLHYDSLGREIPCDLLLLCPQHHDERHGLPGMWRLDRDATRMRSILVELSIRQRAVNPNWPGPYHV